MYRKKMKYYRKKYKIVIRNLISAILIVLVWFILYCLCNNHFFLCSTKEECTMLHQNIDWEMVNDISFTAVYLVIEVWNCGVKNFQYGGYIIIQLMLDYAIFWLCFILMEMTS